MKQKRLTIILSSALVLAVAVAVVFLSPLGAAIAGSGQPEASRATAAQSGSAVAASGQSSDQVSASGSASDKESAAGASDGSAANAATAGGNGGAGSDGTSNGGAGNGGQSSNAPPAGNPISNGNTGQTAQVPTFTVYVAIECAVAVGNPNLSPSKKAYVPANGWILGSTPVTLQEGQTVLDATQAVVRANGIQMDVAGGGYTAYVRGINNLYERDCGNQSGWKFDVNGSYPNIGCGQVELHSGDTVNWIYSLSV